VSGQDLASAISAVFIVGMVWLRTRMHYAQRARGALHLKQAGRAYFAAVLALLVVGWFAAPALGRWLWPATAVNPTVTRVLWFLATYYVFIVVHRILQSRHVDVFGAEQAPPQGESAPR
jgi:hypothetical protein